MQDTEQKLIKMLWVGLMKGKVFGNPFMLMFAVPAF